MKTGAAAAGAATGLFAHAEPSSAASPGVPLLHVTDLFHPHGDSDDHFDPAVAYALAQRGSFDLRGVVRAVSELFHALR